LQARLLSDHLSESTPFREFDEISLITLPLHANAIAFPQQSSVEPNIERKQGWMPSQL
jgi:hypothetical protein